MLPARLEAGGNHFSLTQGPLQVGACHARARPANAVSASSRLQIEI